MKPNKKRDRLHRRLRSYSSPQSERARREIASGGRKAPGSYSR